MISKISVSTVKAMLKEKASCLGLMRHTQYRDSASRARTLEYSNTSIDCPQDFKTLCSRGLLKEALEYLHIMDSTVGSSKYQSILRCCVKKKRLSEGKVVHAHMKMRGFMSDIFVVNALMDMYAKCGSLEDACKVFNEMPFRSLYSWTMIIGAYSRYGLADEGLKLFHQMELDGVEPDNFLFATVLQVCGKVWALDQGKKLHEDIVRRELESDLVVGNALIDMYAKCGSLEDAKQMFDKMPKRNVVSWSTIIWGYVESENVIVALELFRQMLIEGVKPDAMTLVNVIAACSISEFLLGLGKEVHEEVIRRGFQSNVIVGSCLVDMYVNCRRIEDARQVFDKMPKRNLVSWTAMIAGYVQNGFADAALTLFHEMRYKCLTVDSKAFASVIPACARLGDLQQGMEIHGEVIQSGFKDDLVVSSALVDMYAKCGKMEKARYLFDKMSVRDVVSWNTIIGAYSRDGPFEEALTLFYQMHEAGIQPDQISFASVLPACGKLVDIGKGMEIHAEIIINGFHPNSFVENALSDMYAKCGRIDNVQRLFEKMHQHNAISWNAIIGGYAIHGHGKEALKLFEQMQQSGVNPDDVTLHHILSACRNASLVKEGQQYFNIMTQYYHISPTLEHYACMVELLSCVGHLEEAAAFIKKMPVEPDANVWQSLLGGYRVHNNRELTECIPECLFELDPTNAVSYILLLSIFNAAAIWNGVFKEKESMKIRNVEKVPECSRIEIS